MTSTKEFIHPNHSSINFWNAPASLPTAAATAWRPAARADGNPDVPSDEQLMALARDGDNNAFEQLIQRHRGMCMKRALSTLHDRSDAEDAVQIACRKAFQYLGQFHGKGTFAGWLGRIVENECLMRIREERGARFVYLDEQTRPNVRLELVGQTSNPEDELGRQEVRRLLHDEMLRMPPLFRNIMLLHDGEELPMPDIAERLELSVPAAKSRLMRARRELRSRLEKHCGPKGPGTLLAKAPARETAYARAS